MSNIIKIIMRDAKSISTNVVATVIFMGLCVIPSLYAWFNINSNWDPYSEEATSNLQIAVYSEDKGIKIENKNLRMLENAYGKAPYGQYLQKVADGKIIKEY